MFVFKAYILLIICHLSSARKIVSHKMKIALPVKFLEKDFSFSGFQVSLIYEA